jgi:hypothetical protein
MEEVREKSWGNLRKISYLVNKSVKLQKKIGFVRCWCVKFMEKFKKKIDRTKCPKKAELLRKIYKINY